jgi:hypothetical protein
MQTRQEHWHSWHNCEAVQTTAKFVALCYVVRTMSFLREEADGVKYSSNHSTTVRNLEGLRGITIGLITT